MTNDIFDYALDGDLDGLKREILKLCAENKDKTMLEIINMRNIDGKTPLIFAIRESKKNLEVFQYLIEQGADLKARGSKKDSLAALDITILRASRKMENGENAENLFEMIKIMLRKDSSLLDVKGEDGITPFDTIDSIEEEQTEIKRKLLQIVAEIIPSYPRLPKELILTASIDVASQKYIDFSQPVEKTQEIRRRHSDPDSIKEKEITINEIASHKSKSLESMTSQKEGFFKKMIGNFFSSAPKGQTPQLQQENEPLLKKGK